MIHKEDSNNITCIWLVTCYIDADLLIRDVMYSYLLHILLTSVLHRTSHVQHSLPAPAYRSYWSL